MNHSIVAGLTGLVAGAIAGTAILVLGAPTGSGDDGPRTLTSTNASESVELADAVARIDRDQRDLNDAFELHRTSIDQRLDEVLAAVNRRAIPATTDRANADEGASTSDLAASLDPASLPAPTDPQFETAVAAAIENIEARERAERDAERETRELERIEERLADMRTKLGLDQFQETEMRTLLIDSMHTMDETRDLMRSGEMDRGDIRQAFDDIRTSADETLQSILTPAQYQQYQDENMGGFGGGRQRGGFGGGGNGGGGNGGGPF